MTAIKIIFQKSPDHFFFNKKWTLLDALMRGNIYMTTQKCQREAEIREQRKWEGILPRYRGVMWEPKKKMKGKVDYRRGVSLTHTHTHTRASEKAQLTHFPSSSNRLRKLPAIWSAQHQTRPLATSKDIYLWELRPWGGSKTIFRPWVIHF